MAHPSRAARALVLVLLMAALAFVPSASAATGVVNVFGSGDFGSNSPRGIAIDETTGNVYVADGSGGNRILRYSADGTPLSPQMGSGSSSNTKGNFNTPSGVAINQADRSVWVTDAGNLRIQKFAAADVFGVHAFDLAAGWDVTSGGVTTFEVCTAADTCKNGVAGAGDGQFAGNVLSFTGQPAVDPTTGAVYVADPVNRRVQRFGADGSFQAKFGDSTLFGTSSPTRVAVDSTGAVYVVDPGNGRVLKCLSLVGPPETFDCTVFADSHLTGKSPYAIAIDGDDDGVFVAFRADTPLPTSSEEIHVAELESDGDLVAVHGVGSGITTTLSATTLNNYGGLAVNSATDAMYLTVSHGVAASRQVFVIDEVLPPSAAVTPATDVTPRTATINGTVNPNGSRTDYRFEYRKAGTTAWTAVPTPDADAGSGQLDVPVSHSLTGLTPLTEYDVRLVATKPYNAGTTTSETGTFTTAPLLPGAVTGAALHVTDTTARVRGRVDPSSQPTTYRFEYGTDTSYGSEAPVPAGDAGDGHAEVFLFEDLEGLQPGTTYHYRLVAINPSGTTAGADGTFTTDADPAAPNDRTYELVSSSTDTNLHDVFRVQPARDDGSTVSYKTTGAPDGSGGNHLGAMMRSYRTSAGWVSEPYGPLAIGGTFGQATVPVAFDPSQSRVLLKSDYRLLMDDDDGGKEDIYGYDVETGALDLLSVGALVPDDVTSRTGRFAGASEDLSHVVLLINDQPSGPFVNPDFSFQQGVFERVGGVLRTVSLVGPEQSPSTQYALSADYSARTGFESGSSYGTQVAHGGAHAVSADGSRIYFSNSNGAKAALFLRQDGATTIPVSRSRRDGDPVAAERVRFIAATPDGSSAYFASDKPLTDDATGGDHLYRFDADTDSLELLADDPSAGGDAINWGIASDDGSHVYFVSTGVLADGAVAGDHNAYVWSEDGGVELIAAVDPSATIARVSRDGRYAAIATSASIGDADVGGHKALYLYDAATGELSCASCRADGSPSEGDAALDAIPLGSPMADDLTRQRNITDDGRLFFTSTDRIVPEDVSSVQDVYEFHDGVPRLISTGRSDFPSFVADNSDDGRAVFFLTRDALVPEDDDNGQMDLYDARIGGGFPQQAPPPPPCEGDGCQGRPAGKPELERPASESFAGPGDAEERPRANFSLRRLSTAQRARLARGKAVRMRVRVSRAGRVTATARAKVGGRTRVVARGSRRAARAGNVALRLRLSRDARRRISAGRSLRVSVSVRFGGASAPKTLRFQLKPVKTNGR